MVKQIVLCDTPTTALEGVSDETFEALSAKHGWDYKAMLVEQKDLRLKICEINCTLIELRHMIDEMVRNCVPIEQIFPHSYQHHNTYKKWKELKMLKFEVDARLRGIWKEAAAGLNV